MNRQAILDLLNSLEVVEHEVGEEPYILVNQSPEVVNQLNQLGVSQDTISKYGDGETFCILALAFGERYADFHYRGKLRLFENDAERIIYELEDLRINNLVRIAHKNAVNKGWWDEERSFGDIIALIHSEASEALEDFRNGNKPTAVWYEKKDASTGEVKKMSVQPYEDWKPCGIPSELADIVIRVFDACGRYGIDLEREINEKMAYNATRPVRHGGKTL